MKGLLHSYTGAPVVVVYRRCRTRIAGLDRVGIKLIRGVGEAIIRSCKQAKGKIVKARLDSQVYPYSASKIQTQVFLRQANFV